LDSDSEGDDEGKDNDMDSELAELLNDEEDIDLEPRKEVGQKGGIQINLINKKIIKEPESSEGKGKTIYRDKGGKIIDPLTESKAAKAKELERKNYENVSMYINLLSWQNGERESYNLINKKKSSRSLKECETNLLIVMILTSILRK
jgi:hypothetical protein